MMNVRKMLVVHYYFKNIVCYKLILLLFFLIRIVYDAISAGKNEVRHGILPLCTSRKWRTSVLRLSLAIHTIVRKEQSHVWWETALIESRYKVENVKKMKKIEKKPWQNIFKHYAWCRWNAWEYSSLIRIFFENCR